jgi:5'-nucleotidase (lipoprotein e(P4) family)
MKKYFALIITSFAAFTALSQDQSKQTIQLNSIEELKLLSTLWQQDAAEYRALCYQAFNTATMQVDALPKKMRKKQHLAIITDLDETILDNSYNEAQLMKDNKSWNYQSWKQWTDLSAATGVPGAVEFLQYAKHKGISIFYSSNRNVNEVASTLINLQKLHLPDADTSHMLFMHDDASKESRRQTVMKNYTVIMLLGDNLNDFSNVFEGINIANRFTQTDNAKDEWGKKFIVLPNATYGEWENALYNYQYNLTPEQKINLLRSLLKGIPQ